MGMGMGMGISEPAHGPNYTMFNACNGEFARTVMRRRNR